MGEVIKLFADKNEREIDRRAYLIQRAADLAVEISLLESEKERIEDIINGRL